MLVFQLENERYSLVYAQNNELVFQEWKDPMKGEQKRKTKKKFVGLHFQLESLYICKREKQLERE